MPDAILIQVAFVAEIHIYNHFVVVVRKDPRKGTIQNAIPERFMVFVSEMIQVECRSLLVIWGVEVYQALSIAVLPLEKLQEVHSVQVENFK